MTLTSEQIELLLLAVLTVLILDYVFIIARFNNFISKQQKLNENYVSKIVNQFEEITKTEK